MRLDQRFLAASLSVALAATLTTTLAGYQKGTAPRKLKFEVSVPGSTRAEPVTGRVFVIITKVNDREPRLQPGRTGPPFFGRDVEGLKPGQPATIDETDLGSPVESLSEIPAHARFSKTSRSRLDSVLCDFERGPTANAI